jgi:hypothetical protein
MDPRINQLLTELRLEIEKLKPSRERSLVQTKIDEAALWLRAYADAEIIP